MSNSISRTVRSIGFSHHVRTQNERRYRQCLLDIQTYRSKQTTKPSKLNCRLCVCQAVWQSKFCISNRNFQSDLNQIATFTPFAIIYSAKFALGPLADWPRVFFCLEQCLIEILHAAQSGPDKIWWLVNEFDFLFSAFDPNSIQIWSHKVFVLKATVGPSSWRSFWA